MVQCATRWKRCANENNGWVCSSGQGDFAVSRSNAGESRGVYDATWKLWHCLPAEKLKDHRATQAHALEQSYRPTPDRVTPSRYSDDACCSSRSVFLGPPGQMLSIQQCTDAGSMSRIVVPTHSDGHRAGANFLYVLGRPAKPNWCCPMTGHGLDRRGKRRTEYRRLPVIEQFSQGLAPFGPQRR